MSDREQQPPFDQRLGVPPAEWWDVDAPAPWRVVGWPDDDHRAGSADNRRSYPRLLEIGARGFGLLGLAVFDTGRELARIGIPDAAVGLVGAVLHRCGPHLLVGAGRTLCWLELPSLGERRRAQLTADLGRVRAMLPLADNDDVLIGAELGMARVDPVGQVQWTFLARDVVTGWSMTPGRLSLQLDRGAEVHLDLASGTPCPP